MHTKWLLVNTPSSVLVNLPWDEESLSQHAVDKLTLTQRPSLLLALNRLAYCSDHTQNEKVQALTALETHLIKTTNLTVLIDFAFDLYHQLKLDFKEETLNNLAFVACHQRFLQSPYGKSFCKNLSLETYYNCMTPPKKWGYLYAGLISHLAFPRYHLQEAGWNPTSGAQGLMASLQSHGAHIFTGDFDRCQNDYPSIPSESTSERRVFCFPKHAHLGVKKQGVQSIVVDQMKYINGTPTVFFHDPHDAFFHCELNPIFALNYDHFVKRLRHLTGMPYSIDNCAKLSFGIVSKCPDKLF